MKAWEHGEIPEMGQMNWQRPKQKGFGGLGKTQVLQDRQGSGGASKAIAKGKGASDHSDGREKGLREKRLRMLLIKMKIKIKSFIFVYNS